MVTKRDKIIGTAFVGLLLLSCIYVLSGSEDTDPSSFHSSLEWTWNNYDQVLQEAQHSQKCVFIDFWAVWCKECTEMEQKEFSTPEVTDLLNEFILLKVDVDEVPELKAHFSIGGMPTIVVVNAQGEEVGRVVGYQNAHQLKSFLEDILAQDL
jgi:thiol:disulfide interchange protein DsbD